MILAIDPGPKESGWLQFNTIAFTVGNFGIWPNERIIAEFDDWEGDSPLEADTAIIEWIESYSMPVGQSIFETVFWIGRFTEAWWCTPTVRRLTRREVKLHLCNSARAKDANIRQALIDRFGPGKQIAIGNKKNPGPLYGIKSHLWSALALAVTFAETRLE